MEFTIHNSYVILELVSSTVGVFFGWGAGDSSAADDPTKKKGGELRCSRRHPPSYSYMQSSPVKVLAVIEERKHLPKIK
jgi:hypothetical protein